MRKGRSGVATRIPSYPVRLYNVRLLLLLLAFQNYSGERLRPSSSFYCDLELSDKGDSQTTTRGTEGGRGADGGRRRFDGAAME